MLPLALPTARPPAKSAGSAEAPFCHYKDGYRGILLAQQRCPGGMEGRFYFFSYAATWASCLENFSLGTAGLEARTVSNLP